MHSTAPARCATLLVLLAGCVAYGQSPALPPTPATQLPTAAPTPAVQPARAERHPATVVYSNGLLQVTADNSSLNMILRDIAAETRMTIYGGVVDQPVFGKYGPAKPAEVLGTLLDGTGTNMLLRETASDAPAELILTPQTGGPTPSSPILAFDAQAPSTSQPSPPPPSAWLPTAFPQTGLQNGNQTGPQTPPAFGGASDTGPPVAPGPRSINPLYPPSPNGVSPPQQPGPQP